MSRTRKQKKAGPASKTAGPAPVRIDQVARARHRASYQEALERARQREGIIAPMPHVYDELVIELGVDPRDLYGIQVGPRVPARTL